MDPAQPLQPDLVKSATDDDESSSVSGKGHDKAIEYLLRYETMVRQQEAEDMATLAHVRPILKRIEKLSGEESSYAEDIMAREITFVQLQRALEVLEQDSSEPMTTDRQLMMVLRTLARKSPENEDECISFAEFYQCYKTVVTGMQTLQYVPSASLVRSRTKDRILTILSLFEPPSTKLFNEDVPLTIHTNDEEALVGDRRYVPLNPRTRRKRNMVLLVIGFLVTTAALFYSNAMTSSDGTDEKPVFEFNNMISHVKETGQVAKTALISWLLEALDAEMTRPKAEVHPFSPFEVHPFSPFSLKTDKSSNEEAVTSPVILEEGTGKAVAILAGATGVAVAPAVWGAATFLLRTAAGLSGLGVLTVFSVALAPVLNGLDICIGKIRRNLRNRKK